MQGWAKWERSKAESGKVKVKSGKVESRKGKGESKKGKANGLERGKENALREKSPKVNGLVAFSVGATPCGQRREARNHLRQSAKSAGNKTRAIRVLPSAPIRAICVIRVPLI